MGKRKIADRYPDVPPQNKGARYQAWVKTQLLLYEQILRGMAEGVIVMTPEHRITFANPAAEKLFLIEQAQLKRSTVNNLFCDEQGYYCGTELMHEAVENPIQGKLVRLRRHNHPSLIVEANVTSLKIGDEIVRLIVTMRDVSIEQAQKKKLEIQALHDRLTGCTNRWWFDEQYLHLLEEARKHDVWLGLIFIDLDNFKKFNDESYMWGDRLIKIAADVIRSVLRPTDRLTRLGGDEFILICYDIAPQAVQDIAHRIQAALKSVDLRMPRDPSITFQLTASIGVSVLHGTDAHLDQLLDFAQDAKRQAKLRGKDRIITLPVEDEAVAVLH